MKHIHLLLFLFINTFLPAQQKQFHTVAGGTKNDHGRSVQEILPEKSYIVGGTTGSFGLNGSTDMYLVKVDSLGYKLWQKTYGSVGSEQGNCVTLTSDGGFAFLGYTSIGNGGYDFYLVKTNGNGDTLWTKKYGGSDWDFGYYVKQLSDGGYIMVGGTYSYGKGDQDVYLVRTNSNGDTLWTKTYGGTSTDMAEMVWPCLDGGFFLTGYTQSFGNGGWDLYYIKTDANGDTTWTKTLGGKKDDQAFKGREVTGGGFIMGGYTGDGNTASDDFYLVKLATNGDTLWTKKFGGYETERAYGVDEVPSNLGYIMCGITNGAVSLDEVYLYWTDVNGNFVNSTKKGGANAKEDEGYDIHPTADGGFIMVGSTKSFGKGLSDVYLIKMNDQLQSPSAITGIPSGFIADPVIKASMFPNPVTDISTLKIENVLHPENLEVVIIDITGKEIKKIVFHTNGTADINKTELSAGMYIYKIIDNSSLISCGKFLVD